MLILKGIYDINFQVLYVKFGNNIIGSINVTSKFCERKISLEIYFQNGQKMFILEEITDPLERSSIPSVVFQVITLCESII